MKTKQIALITGATSGIGLATAQLLAQKGFDLIITGRREERLDEIKEQIEDQNDVRVLRLVFSVRDMEKTYKKLLTLPRSWENIDVLINNAGLAAGAEPIGEADVADTDTMIDTNIKGLLYVTNNIIPRMKEKRSGHIINIGSVASKEVYAGGSVYCATKHAVEALTKGMRIDLLPYNIRVTQIAPGMVETEFSLVRFKGDQKKADEVYQGLQPLTGEDIAETVAWAIERPPHVNINDIWIMPTAQASTRYVQREES